MGRLPRPLHPPRLLLLPRQRLRGPHPLPRRQQVQGGHLHGLRVHGPRPHRAHRQAGDALHRAVDQVLHEAAVYGPALLPRQPGAASRYQRLLLNIDDHRDLHGDEEAPHIVELDGTTVPWSGAAELGQRLRLHGPRPPRWLLALVNKSSQGRDSVTAIYSNSNPWTTSTRTKTSNVSSSLPRTRYSICASSQNLLCTPKSMRRSAHCSTISLLNWEEQRSSSVKCEAVKCEAVRSYSVKSSIL